MSEGVIKWFNSKKGFGFIGNEKGPDVYIHFSVIEGDDNHNLQPGDVVMYDQVQGEWGPKATKVIKKTLQNALD